MKTKIYILLSLFLISTTLFSQEKKEQKDKSEDLIKGLCFRSIGPAVASGRVVDIAVNPDNFSERYIAVAR